jgi:hypothetical protein
MQNPFEPGDTRNQPAFRPENLDFAMIFRILRHVAAGLILAWELFPWNRRIRSHLLFLGALIFVFIAAGHWLARYTLLFTRMGAVQGVGHAEHHLTLPVLVFLTAIALVSAGLLVASIWAGRGAGSRPGGNNLIAAAVGGWLIIYILANGVLPGAFQRLRAEPCGLAKERPRRNLHHSGARNCPLHGA